MRKTLDKNIIYFRTLNPICRCSRLFYLFVLHSADEHGAGGALPRGGGRAGNDEHPAGQSRHVPRLRDRPRVQVGVGADPRFLRGRQLQMLG